MSKESISGRERDLAEFSLVTPASLETRAKYFTIPFDPRGKFILDLGSGASTLVSQLRELGANAIATDYGYKNIRDITNKAVDFSTRPLFDNKHRNELLKTIVKFHQSILNEPDLYVAGLAGELPFKSNSFDLVITAGLFGTILIKDKDTLERAINEALRVVKPGCEVQIAPWAANFWSEEERINSGKILKPFMDEGYKLNFIELGNEYGTLRLKKPLLFPF